MGKKKAAKGAADAAPAGAGISTAPAGPAGTWTAEDMAGAQPMPLPDPTAVGPPPAAVAAPRVTADPLAGVTFSGGGKTTSAGRPESED